MPIRITGMNSGLDTESIISELVKAKSVKKDSLVKAQTKLEWKQEAWKELNAKVYALYSKTLSNMRLESDYTKKTTKVSNPSAASVITSGNAIDGVQKLKINQLATTCYYTGGELAEKDANGNDVKGSTKLTDLGITSGSKIKIDGKEITTDDEMTIDKLVTEFKNAGVNASYDEKNNRFFVSAKESGAAGNFTIENVAAEDGTITDVLSELGLAENQVTDVVGVDAQIELNGAIFESNTNTFEINGLTITANEVTANEITITTSNDTDGIYDMVKNFFKEYNTLINEMDKLYNAESSKGYEPLTDEEKEAMSEKDIEKWEEKIKNSLLRRDSTLNTVASAMKEVMMRGVAMKDGSQVYLSDFGIGTLGYFTAKDNEKNAYHIDGDPDDASTMTNTDKLKAAIATDPDKVVEFFSTLTKNLYEKIGDMMKKTEYSSSFTLYDDVAMKDEYNDYKTKISKQEQKITDYEDRYYKKFSAMETALAKLQSKESAISGLFNI